MSPIAAAKTSSDEDAVWRDALALAGADSRASAPATPRSTDVTTTATIVSVTVRMLVLTVPNALWNSALSGPDVMNAVVRDT